MRNIGNRWICAQCGGYRRQHECLACGSTKPITSEKQVSPYVR